MFSQEELIRYGRHFTLPQIGEEGQAKIKESSVVVIGAGGLGSPVSLYLAAAGVGRLGLVDFDKVDLSNLQRQVVHSTSNVGRSKLESASERLREINPHVNVELHAAHLTSSNALDILGRYDVIIDGTDNFPTRYLVNDAAVFLGKPNVYGSVFRFEGQASVFWAPKGPCYRCLYSEPPPPGLVPSCEEGGVLGVVPGLIGMIQATEAIKLITGVGESMVGRLLLFDALRMSFREVRLPRNPQCVVCGENPTVRQLIDYESFCGIKKDMTEQPFEVAPGELAERRGVRVVDVREPWEWATGHLRGAEHHPLRSLPSKVDSFSPDEEIVFYCKMGGRSGQAAQFFRNAGFTKAKSLTGGIDRWIAEGHDTET